MSQLSQIFDFVWFISVHVLLAAVYAV